MYDSFLDYIGDRRAPVRLDVPPGGSSGSRAVDAHLCVIAERAWLQSDPVAYLRDQAAHYARMEAWVAAAIVEKISQWCAEFEQAAA